MKLAILLFYLSVGISTDLSTAKMLIVQEQYVEALQLLDNDTDARARYYAGWCHMKMGNCSNAVDEFNVFIQTYNGYGAESWKEEAAANIMECSGTVVSVASTTDQASIRVWAPEDYQDIKKEKAPIKIWSSRDAAAKAKRPINIWVDEVNPRQKMTDAPTKIYNATSAASQPRSATSIWPDQDVDNTMKTFSNAEILDLKTQIDEKVNLVTNKEKGDNEPMVEHITNKEKGDNEPMVEHITNKEKGDNEPMVEHITNKEKDDSEPIIEHITNKEKGDNEPMLEHIINKEKDDNEPMVEHVNNKEKGDNEPMVEHITNKEKGDNEPMVEHITNKEKGDNEPMVEHITNKEKGDNEPMVEHKTDNMDWSVSANQHHFKILFKIENYPQKEYLSLSNIGPVTSKKGSAGTYLYYVGYYLNKEEADKALTRVKSAGFPVARVMEFNEGQLEKEYKSVDQETVDKPIENKKDVPTKADEEKLVKEEVVQEIPQLAIEEVIKSEVISYHILFRILDNPYETFDDLKSVGPLYRETFDAKGNSRYLVGNTDNIDDAKIMLETVKKAGYEASFIAEYKNGSLNKIIQK